MCRQVSLQRFFTRICLKMSRDASISLLPRFAFLIATLIAPQGVGLASRIVEVKRSST